MFIGTQNPWHKVIACKRGHIAPAGGTSLWACTNSRASRICKRLLINEWLKDKSGEPQELARMASSELRDMRGDLLSVSASEVTRYASNMLPCTIVMDGGDEINAEFDVSDWKVMFRFMKAKRR
jgi:hypothetical protein